MPAQKCHVCTQQFTGEVVDCGTQGCPGRGKRDPLLIEREKTHGSFNQNASAWNHFISAHGLAVAMKAEQSLALHMIYVKIARALQNPNVKDHWDDIAGYAKLGAEACE